MYKRRAYQRFIVEDKATLITNDKTEKLVSLKDISAGGVSVVTNSLPSVNDRLKLLIDAPNILNKTEIRDASITWCRKLSENSWQVGLSFDNKVLISRVLIQQVREKQTNKKSNLKIITAYILTFIFFTTTLILGIILLNGTSQTFTLQGIAFEPNGKSTAVFVTKANKIGEVEIKRINKDTIEMKIDKKIKILKLGQKITFLKNMPFVF
ncbi:MAG: PilZ domain-containing protein [Candidatus Omnitrophica bacterium]|nr:PilZ domain-containing protein [Candidatus Omnitrophota bacterium]